MYTVYCHINKINGKMYFGITGRRPEERWGANGNNYKSTPHFFSAIQKYGWNNFEHIILFENLTREVACEIEKMCIKIYNTQDKEFGYNILEGGQVEELPEEVRRKMSMSMMGNQNGKGHPCSEEKKEKIRQSQKGRKFSEEHKQKLSEAAKNRHTPCSEEKKKKLSENYPNQRKVYCVETDIVYRSVQECARALGLYATNVSKVCRGIHKTTGGYHFKFYDDTINA